MADKYLNYEGLSWFWSKIQEKLNFKRDKYIWEKSYTGLIGSANDQANASFYFAKILPTNYNAQWKIKGKLWATWDFNDTDSQYIEFEVCGYCNAMASYYNKVARTTNLLIYFMNLYRATSAGLSNGYGHLLGVGLRSSYAPTNSGYKRNIRVQIVETENCEVIAFDTPVKYSEAPGMSTTNYTGPTEMNAGSNGFQETGDADTKYQNIEYYPKKKTYTNLYRYQWLFTMRDREYLLPVNAVSNSTSNTKTLTTEKFDPFGEYYFWNTTTTYNAGDVIVDGYTYRQYLADVRYAFNVTGQLVGGKPFYIVAVPQEDGTAILHSTPVSQELPTTEDGLLYIYMGGVYTDATPYRVSLTTTHPVYKYVNGAVRAFTSASEYAQNAGTVNGHTVQSDVPANAVFTDTTYSAGTGLALNGTTFSNSGVTGVKGNANSTYKTGNVSLTPEDIGAYRTNYYLSNTNDVSMRPLVDKTRANRLAFLPASQVIIEKTTDGGVTWEDAQVSDTEKLNLFSEINATVLLPFENGVTSGNCGLRITFTAMKYNVPEGTPETGKYAYWNSSYLNTYERYCNVREFWFWFNSVSDSLLPKIYAAKGSTPDTWDEMFGNNGESFKMTGSSGSAWIRAGGGSTFGGYGNQTTNYWNWRLEFWIRPYIGRNDYRSTTQLKIHQIRMYGDNVWFTPNNLMHNDHLYSWDGTKKMILPGSINIAGIGSGTADVNRTVWFSDNTAAGTPVRSSNFQYNPSTDVLTVGNVNGKVNNHTVNADVPSGAEFTDTVTTATTTGNGNAVTAVTAYNGNLTVTKGATFLTEVPAATANTLGGVKIGNGITISDGVISAEAPLIQGVTVNGVAQTITNKVVNIQIPYSSVNNEVLTIGAEDSSGGGSGGGGGGGSYTLPTASASTLGGVKIGSGITITNGVISAITQAQVESLISTAINNITDGDEVSY